jgi:aminoglycoside phosphotransferase (APT) family kinase protein
LSALAALPDGDQICHGDFHPANILLTTQGDVVIDWNDATLGNPLADVARFSVLALGAVATPQIPSRRIKRVVRHFHDASLRRYFQLRPGGEDEYRRWLPIMAAARLSEGIPELTDWLVAQALDTDA